MKTIRAVTCAFATLSLVFLFVAMVTPGWIDMKMGETHIKLNIFYMTVCHKNVLCTTKSTVDIMNAATSQQHSSMSSLAFTEYIAECLMSVIACAIASLIVLCTLRRSTISRNSLITAAVLFLLSMIMTFVLAGRMLAAYLLLNDLFTSSILFPSETDSYVMNAPYSIVLEFIGGAVLLLAMISSFIWAYQTKPQPPVPIIAQSHGFTHVQVSTRQQMMVPIQQAPTPNIPYSKCN